MSEAKLIAERDIREYLSSIGKSYIRTSFKALVKYKIFLYEISG